jgi:hypothetical protein
MLVGNIFSIFDTNILGDLLLRRTHQIGGVRYAEVKDVALKLLAKTNLHTLGLQCVPRPTPMTLSTAVCQNTTIASSILHASSECSLRHLFDKLVSSRLTLVPFLNQNAKSPTTSKIKMLKERGTRSASLPNICNTHTGLDSTSELHGLITWVNRSVKGVSL